MKQEILALVFFRLHFCLHFLLYTMIFFLYKCIYTVLFIREWPKAKVLVVRPLATEV